MPLLDDDVVLVVLVVVVVSAAAAVVIPTTPDTSATAASARRTEDEERIPTFSATGWPPVGTSFSSPAIPPDPEGCASCAARARAGRREDGAVAVVHRAGARARDNRANRAVR
jgi:hypothetical protein